MIATPTNTPSRQPSPAAGFTLIELLMVIVLIAILVGLITFAAQRALNRGGEARTLTEMSLLSNAIEQYKLQYGSYPPNPGTEHNTGPVEPGKETMAQRGQRIQRHVARAFPRYTGVIGDDIETATAYSVHEEAGATAPDYLLNGLKIANLDPAEALVFWIGGMPQIYYKADDTYAYELTGFSSNPASPFSPSSSTDEATVRSQPQRTERLFEFDLSRLVDRDQDGWPEYVFDGNTPLDTPPYVYFDAPTYDLGAYYPLAPLVDEDANEIDAADREANESSFNSQWGVCRPYARLLIAPDNYQWMNDQGFQLIASGLDGQYGTVDTGGDQIRIISSGENFTEYDADNLTNFSDQRLGEVLDSEGANP